MRYVIELWYRTKCMCTFNLPPHVEENSPISSLKCFRVLMRCPCQDTFGGPYWQLNHDPWFQDISMRFWCRSAVLLHPTAFFSYGQFGPLLAWDLVWLHFHFLVLLKFNCIAWLCIWWTHPLNSTFIIRIHVLFTDILPLPCDCCGTITLSPSFQTSAVVVRVYFRMC